MIKGGGKTALQKNVKEGKKMNELRKDYKTIETEIIEAIGEKKGNGIYGLKACVTSVIFDLQHINHDNIITVRQKYLDHKIESCLFNDTMFEALNLVEKKIYNLKY